MSRTAVLAATLTSLLISGCSSGDGPTADNGQGAASPTQAGPEPSHSPEDPTSDNSEDAAVGTSPIEAAITEAAGYTQNDVAAAVNAARFDSIVACMAKKGWDSSHSDLPDPGLGPNESIGPFGTQIEYFLDELAAPEDPPETGEAEDDADHPLELIADVRAEAEAGFLNEHGDRIALIAADYSDRLDLYRDYLPHD